MSDWPCWDWVLSCQHTERHPFTGAAPGGWGWTDLSGAVPDADDTPSALLALHAYWRSIEAKENDRREAILRAAIGGVGWLLGLQNRDGGWPTFCRGWGKLPFDRSGSDLTAHAMRAMHAWTHEPGTGDALGKVFGLRKIEKAISRGWKYLERQQSDDGSWLPLWFGNQDHPLEDNPIYGTAKVLFSYRDLEQIETSAAQRGLVYLGQCQNSDGGWGNGTSSVEETALAVEALLASNDTEKIASTVDAGVTWLVRATEDGRIADDSPIGFYFAKLWYHERLYPLIFAASALGRAM
ncbi:MAG: hypothetical protein H8E66_19535 [Planctomycetes bacterium]|nr:hypothetical protein [Planctomycetota bacterium]